MNVPTTFFTVATCKVEAYGAQRETVISVCKFLFWILFAPCMLLLYVSQQWRRRLVHSELENCIGCPERSETTHRTREWCAVSEFFQSRCVQWFKTKRQSTERGLCVNLTTRDTKLAKVCNGDPYQRVKFKKVQNQQFFIRNQRSHFGPALFRNTARGLTSPLVVFSIVRKMRSQPAAPSSHPCFRYTTW